jgi:hypothetical protein
MVFTPIAAGLSLPQWVVDESAAQPAAPWRYPGRAAGAAAQASAGE